MNLYGGGEVNGNMAAMAGGEFKIRIHYASVTRRNDRLHFKVPLLLSYDKAAPLIYS